VNLIGVLAASGLTGAIASAVVGFLLREWISSRIKESIAAEYARALEEFRSRVAWEQKRKEQASEVADVVSLWLKGNYDTKTDPNLTLYELQRRYWGLALWVDAPILRALHEALASPGNPGILHKKALIAVRKLYIGNDDPITPEELYHWPARPAQP
jgi:hypothetical protein